LQKKLKGVKQLGPKTPHGRLSQYILQRRIHRLYSEGQYTLHCRIHCRAVFERTFSDIL